MRPAREALHAFTPSSRQRHWRSHNVATTARAPGKRCDLARMLPSIIYKSVSYTGFHVMTRVRWPRVCHPWCVVGCLHSCYMHALPVKAPAPAAALCTAALRLHLGDQIFFTTPANTQASRHASLACNAPLQPTWPNGGCVSVPHGGGWLQVAPQGRCGSFNAACRPRAYHAESPSRWRKLLLTAPRSRHSHRTPAPAEGTHRQARLGQCTGVCHEASAELRQNHILGSAGSQGRVVGRRGGG